MRVRGKVLKLESKSILTLSVGIIAELEHANACFGRVDGRRASFGLHKHRQERSDIAVAIVICNVGRCFALAVREM
jgi:hypothetical protein